MMRRVLVGLTVLLMILAVLWTAGQPINASEKVTLCHAAGLEGTTHFVEITVGRPAAFGPAGHFFENGTPRAGHEEDYLGPCENEPTSTTRAEPTTTTKPNPTTTTSTTRGATTTTETTAPSSTTSTSTPATTTSISVSTTTVPPTTSVPLTTGTLPLTGLSDVPLLAGWAIALGALGGLAILTARSRKR